LHYTQACSKRRGIASKPYRTRLEDDSLTPFVLEGKDNSRCLWPVVPLYVSPSIVVN
jgi:hypothetical protein